MDMYIYIYTHTHSHPDIFQGLIFLYISSSDSCRSKNKVVSEQLSVYFAALATHQGKLGNPLLYMCRGSSSSRCRA